jgi:hypothetical protein
MRRRDFLAATATSAWFAGLAFAGPAFAGTAGFGVGQMVETDRIRFQKNESRPGRDGS